MLDDLQHCSSIDKSGSGQSERAIIVRGDGNGGRARHTTTVSAVIRVWAAAPDYKLNILTSVPNMGHDSKAAADAASSVYGSIGRSTACPVMLHTRP